MKRAHLRFAAIPKGCARAGVVAALLFLPFTSSCRMMSSTLSDAEFHTSPALEKATELRSALGERFRLHHSQHYIVVTDARGGDAGFVLATLSQLHDDFYAHASAIGLSPAPLRDRLVCVLFEHRPAYEDYLRRIEGDGTDWSAGHYSQESNVVVLHHDRDNPGLAQVRGEAHTKPAEMTTPALAAVAELATLHKTRHEAAHQLLYNTGVLVRGQSYPAWLNEGLATLFETNSTEPNPFRLAIYRRMRDEGSLMSVEELVAADLMTIEPEAIGRYYTQAWAFTHFLWNRQPERLRACLDASDLHIAAEGDTTEAGFRRFMNEIGGG